MRKYKRNLTKAIDFELPDRFLIQVPLQRQHSSYSDFRAS